MVSTSRVTVNKTATEVVIGARQNTSFSGIVNVTTKDGISTGLLSFLLVG